MKKRILQFIPSFENGGSERQAIAITRMLSGEGAFDVYAATLNSRGPLANEAATLGVRGVPEYPLTSFYNANFISQVRACASYLRSERIDLVHTHDFYTNVFGMAAGTLARVPIKIASKRETLGLRSRTQDLVERIAFGRADAVVVNAHAVAKHIALPPGKVHTIYNGTDTKRFENLNGHVRAARQTLGLPSGEQRVITLIANLRHQVKNVPMFLRAAKLVADRFADVRFVVAGEGKLEAELRALATDLRLASRVIFTGRFDNVPGLLSTSYACVLTSSAEGFSNSILEYMAAGKPVVATRVGGAEEAIIENETGFLVDSDDHAALAQRLIRLLENHDLAQRLGEAGRLRARKHFSVETQRRQLLDLYKSLLEIT